MPGLEETDRVSARPRQQAQKRLTHSRHSDRPNRTDQTRNSHAGEPEHRRETEEEQTGPATRAPAGTATRGI